MGAAVSRSQVRSFCAKPSGGMLALLGLQVVFEYGRAGATRPPVTAALLVANSLVYLRPGALDELLPDLYDAALTPFRVIEHGEWSRFFLSAFYHARENHIFHNMTTLLWTGTELETSRGSAEFASMVAALLGLSQGITLLLSKGMLLLGDGTAYYSQYAVGFSGVLFGMKVVRTAGSDQIVSAGGMVIPAKYVTWAELFLIQAAIPDASFLGHLGGILAGYVYLLLNRKAGRRASTRETPRGIWRCSNCAYDSSLASDICEMCSTAREDRAFSRRRRLQAGCNGELTVEELRPKRMQRFNLTGDVNPLLLMQR